MYAALSVGRVFSARNSPFIAWTTNNNAFSGKLNAVGHRWMEIDGRASERTSVVLFELNHSFDCFLNFERERAARCRWNVLGQRRKFIFLNILRATATKQSSYILFSTNFTAFIHFLRFTQR
jgi:hypothetical protein